MSTETADVRITWPARPTCHDNDPYAQRFELTTWRPAGQRLHPENDHVPATRTCSFCGGMHPQDLVAALEMGATMELADMKYGWPHKFYVNGVPDPGVGAMRTIGRISIGQEADGSPREPTAAQRADTKWTWELEPHPRGGMGWVGVMMSPAPATTTVKFYTVHMLDLDAETFQMVALLIHAKTGVLLERQGRHNMRYSITRLPAA